MAAASQLGRMPSSEPRIPIEIGDIHVGSIVWIQPKSSIDPSSIHGLPLDPNSYNHPAIVIRRKMQESGATMVTIAPMTSFGSRDLTASHPHDRSFWMRYLPLAPSPPHPMSGIQLVLKNGAVLEKPSYIQRVCYEVSLGILAHYTRGPDHIKRAKELKLTQGSLKQLIVHMPEPVPWTPISTLLPLIDFEELGDSSTQKSISQPAEANIEPSGSPLPTESIWDMKLNLGDHTLDDGTFDKILRICRISNIQVTVTPAQTSLISSHGLLSDPRAEHASVLSAREVQSTSHRTSRVHDDCDPDQSSFSMGANDPKPDYPVRDYPIKDYPVRVFPNLCLMSYKFLQAHLKPVALLSTASLFVFMTAFVMRRGPIMTYLTIIRMLKS